MFGSSLLAFATEYSTQYKRIEEHSSSAQKVKDLGTIAGIMFAVGVAACLLQDTHVFAPAVVSRTTTPATSRLVKPLSDRLNTAAVDQLGTQDRATKTTNERHGNGTENQPSAFDAGHQIAEALLLSLFWVPILAAGAVGIKLRLRAAARQPPVVAMAATSGANEEEESLREAMGLPPAGKKLVRQVLESSGIRETLRDAVTQSVSGDEPASASTSRASDKLMDKDIQALLRNYVAKTTELNQLLAEQSEVDLAKPSETDMAIKAADNEVLELTREVKLLEVQAKLAAAERDELRAELEAAERSMSALSLSSSDPESVQGRRVAFLALGGFVAIQVLRSILSKSTGGPEENARAA